MSMIDFFEYLASSDGHRRARTRARRRLGVAPGRRRLPARGVVDNPERRTSSGLRDSAGSIRYESGRRHPGRRASSRSVVDVVRRGASVRPTSSRPLSKRYCVKSSSSNGDVEADGRRRDPLALDVDDDLEVRVFLDRLPQLVDRRFRDRGDDEAHLPGVVAEDVGEAGRQHRLEAVVHQAPTPRARATSRCRSSGPRRGCSRPCSDPG